MNAADWYLVIVLSLVTWSVARTVAAATTYALESWARSRHQKEVPMPPDDPLVDGAKAQSFIDGWRAAERCMSHSGIDTTKDIAPAPLDHVLHHYNYGQEKNNG